MRRRRDRTRYTTTSVFGSPENAERLALANLRLVVEGELTERDRTIAIETARMFSGRVFDLEAENQRLADLVLEMRRLMDRATDGGE